MKYCLNSNQSSEYLKKANELKIKYKDRHKIIDFIQSYPEVTIILDMREYNGLIDWDEIKRYKIITKNNFIIALNSLVDINICKNENIKFYWNFPITTFYDLQALKDVGAEYALIEAPLTHDIIKASQIGIKLRMVPNVAYYAFIPRNNGVCGSWIRPEDLEMYEPYLAAIEFEDCDIKKEQALYRIYCEQKAWPGDLKTIITNLNYPGINRMIPKDLTEKRMTCKQKCQAGAHCKLCYRYLDLANPELFKNYISNN